MNKKINTILFDVDGTIIDSNELIISSFLHTLDIFFPEQYKREDVIPFIGPTLKETFSNLCSERFEEMITTYREHNYKHHDSMIREFSGVYETLKKLSQEGINIGAVTSKIHDVARRGLKLCKLEDFFHCVVGSDDVVKPKPDPEPILKALALLQSSKEETIMVGDRHHDILAGKNAGIITVGVSWSLSGRKYLEQYEPDFIIDHISELQHIIQQT